MEQRAIARSAVELETRNQQQRRIDGEALGRSEPLRGVGEGCVLSRALPVVAQLT